MYRFQRESLRFCPRIRELLEEIWDVVDADNNGVVDENVSLNCHFPCLELSLYFQEFVRLYKVLYDMAWAGGSELSSNEIDELGRAEFQRDLLNGDGHSQKKNATMDRVHFQQSIFEMASTWSSGVSSEAYVEFLQKILRNLKDSLTSSAPKRIQRFSGEASKRATKRKLATAKFKLRQRLAIQHHFTRTTQVKKNSIRPRY